MSRRPPVSSVSHRSVSRRPVSHPSVSPRRFKLPARAVLLGIASIGGTHVALAQDGDASEPATYAVLDPRGTVPAVESVPLAARPQDLGGRTIYVIKSWPSGSGFEPFIERMRADLERRFPDVEVRITNRNTPYAEDDPELWQHLQEEADAFVYAAAASSSTTHYAFRWSAGLERMGIPGAVLMYDTLASVAETTRQRQGAPIRYTMLPYPANQMTSGQVDEALDAVVADLTAALDPEERRAGSMQRAARSRILMTGTLDEVQAYFRDNGLSDGLPIVPPTEERVARMLSGTSRGRDEIVGTAMAPEGLDVSVEQVAINGVMAGAEPRHMPVLLASLAAFLERDRNSVIRSTNSFGFMQVVNGPIRNELGLHGGTGLVDPGSHPNAALGRALRLFVVNLGGGMPGTNLMAVIGTLANWPFLFAELEEQSPWEPLSVARGFAPDESTLTLLYGGWAHAGNYGHVDFDLGHVADDIAEFELPRGATIIVSPKRAELLAEAGMSKQDVKDYLWANALQPLGKMRRERFFSITPAMAELADDALVNVFPRGSIEVVVAGGDASPMMQAWHMYGASTVSIDAWR